MDNLEKRVGKLIVLEGVDSVGKHTQSVLLHERFKKEGYEIGLIDFPQYDTLMGKRVGKYLKEGYGSMKTLDPELPSVLFALNRFECRNQLKNCLLDRYVDSNKAHQGAKLPPEQREMLWEFQERLEFGVLGLPRPDVVVYLKAPYDVVQKLAQQREQQGRTKDMHEQDEDYQRTVVEVYDTLAERGNWLVVACTEEGQLLPREAIAERVWSALQPVLKQ